MHASQLLWAAGILAMIAALSRLLTFLHLWQLKEWRIDRLREHLRGEGWVRQLWGRTDIPLSVFAATLWGLSDSPVIGTLALLPLAGAAVLKMLRRAQPSPVWTRKAIAIVTGGVVALGATTVFFALSWPPAMPLAAVLSPLAALLAWTALKPLDAFLKNRVLARAKSLRAARSDLTVIGVAGSVGKTTTKELLSHILDGKHIRATPAHVNTEMGVSAWMTAQLAHDDAETIQTLIIEMGAYRKGEIRLLCDIAKPSLGIVTSIGQDHLALFGSERAICEANGELLTSLPEDGCAFLNADNEYCDALAALCACKTVTISTGGHADIEAYDIEETSRGIRFRALDTLFDVPVHGTHNVTNVLLAVATATQLGMRGSDIAERLRSFTPPHHTFEIREERGVTILDDTYNASPQSFKAAIEWAKGQPHDRKILVTSGVIELGAREDAIHAELGASSRDIFEKAYILNKKFIPFFSQGFNKKNVYTAEDISPVQPSTLLVCVGRMHPSVIRAFLP